MPFTFAHPAAVLPLRRYCPRYLSLAGLVVGSVVPDAGYFFARYNVDILSHSFAGSFVFDLPVGIIMLVAIYRLRGAVAKRLPEQHRRIFLPLCKEPAGHPLVIVWSILIGVWTHLVWDGFTHPRGWLAGKYPVLLMPVANIGSHTVTICHMLLYISTFAGVSWTCAEYGKWRAAAEGMEPRSVRRTIWLKALGIGAVTVAIEAFHHLMYNLIGFVLVGVVSIVLVVWVALRFGDFDPAARSNT